MSETPSSQDADPAEPPTSAGTELPTSAADARATPYPQAGAQQFGYQQPSNQQPGGYQPMPYPQSPPAPLSVNDEKTWGMLGHISALIGGLFGVAVLGPLIVFLLYKDRSAFVRRHSAESLNFQISLLIYTAAAAVLALVTFGIALIVLIPAGIVAFIVAVVLVILGGVAAYDGREFRYPLTIRFVH
jgi:uncharacterized Tic20 family protein